MAYVGYKRTIQIDFDYEKVKQGVPKVNQQIALLNAEFNKTSASVKATGSAFDKLTINNQKLASQVQLQKDKVSQLQKELDKLTTAETKNERAIASKQIALKNAQAQLTNMQATYAKSNQEMAKATTLSGQAKLAMEDLRLGFERAGVNIDQVKGQFVALGLAVTAFVGSTTKAYMDYESKLVMARNLMDESVMSYKELDDGVMKLSSDYGIAAKEMAAAAEMALSSNVQTADSIKFLNDASRFAIATSTDMITTTDLATSIMNSYGLSMEEVAKMYDELILTQKLAKVSWESYNKEIGNLAALGSTVGVSMEEINAALVVQTRRGIDSATALTNLKGIISSIASPSSQAATAAKELGINFNASTLQSKGFAKVMEQITDKTRGNNEAMATLFGNIRAWQGAQQIAANGGKEFKQVLDELQGTTSMLDNSFENVTETTGYQFNKSLNDVKNAAIELGETFAPLIQVIANVISTIAKMPTSVMITVAGFTTFAITISILKKVMAGLIETGGIVGVILAKLGITSGTAAAGMGVASGTGGILSKILASLGLTSGAAATSLGATATGAGAAATSLGVTAAASGTAASGLGAVGVAGGAAGGGLMMTGAGAQMAMGPIILIVAAVAALAVVLALCAGNGKETSDALKDTGKTAQGVASDVTKAADTAEKQAKRMQKAASASTYSSKTSMGGYATGTNFVREDGWYRYNEYNQQETLLRRGDRVLNGAQTRQLEENSKIDMSETNGLLKQLIGKVNTLENTISNLPKQQQRLVREGGY